MDTIISQSIPELCRHWAAAEQEEIDHWTRPEVTISHRSLSHVFSVGKSERTDPFVLDTHTVLYSIYSI